MSNPATSAEMRTSTSIVSEVIDEGRLRPQQLLVVGLCILLNMIDGFDITAMAVVASQVSEELTLTADKLGWIFSFALAGMMFGAMFLAPISDIVGRRKVIVASIIVVGISILFTANATSLTEFIILRFISGAGAGALLASQATLSAEYTPEKYRAFAVAAVTSGYPIGAMFTSVVAGYVMPDFGWRGMFWFGGSVTLIMGIVAWLLIPESLKYLFEKRPANSLNRVNNIMKKLHREPLQDMPAVSVQKEGSKTGMLSAMLSLLARDHRKVTLIIWSTFFLSIGTLYFMLSWIPKMMEDAGHSSLMGRQAFFLFNLGSVIGIYLLGILSVKLKLTNLICVMLLSAALGMLVFAMAPNELNLLLTYIFLIGLLLAGGYTGLYSAAAKAYPTSIRSTGIGWAIGLGRSGAVAGPAVTGYLIFAGVDMSGLFYIFAIPLFVAAISAYKLHIR